MTLRDWRHNTLSIENSVRVVLRAQRHPDLSRAACKLWAKEFIQALIEGWQPGTRLELKDAQLVGSEFEKLYLAECPHKTVIKAVRRNRR